MLLQVLNISVAAIRLCTTLFETMLLQQPSQVVGCIASARPHVVAMAEAPSRWRDYTLRQKSPAQIAWLALFATILAPESPQPVLFPWSDLAGGGEVGPEICSQGAALRRSVALALEKNAAALDVLADVGWRHEPCVAPLPHFYHVTLFSGTEPSASPPLFQLLCCMPCG